MLEIKLDQSKGVDVPTRQPTSRMPESSNAGHSRLDELFPMFRLTIMKKANHTYAFLLLVLFACRSFGQDQYTPDELKKHFQTVAEQYEMKAGQQNLELRKSPIFFWINNEREQLNGSTYVWERDGRPLVLGSIFTYAWAGQTHCRHELLSLSDRRVTATIQSEVVWTPPESGLQWNAFPKTPLASEEPAKRLSQMRGLARRFSGTLRMINRQPDELRLLSQPLLRYQPTDGDVVDGAIFAYAVATDAEILVIVEAHRDAAGKLLFRYAAAPGHYQELELRLDGNIVWTAPTRMHIERGAMRSSEPYTILTPREPLPPADQLR